MLKDRHPEMAVLNQISTAFAHRRDGNALFAAVFELLQREIGLSRGTVTLRQGDLLFIGVAHNLSEEERKRGRYRLGEGITGQVAAAGESKIVPDIALEPGFLSRIGGRRTRRHAAFICVPVVRGDEVIGTLSGERPVDGADLERDCALLETIANITADAVAECLAEHEEREKRPDESRRLLPELNRGSRRYACLIGNCSRMRKVYALIDQVADSNATVLIRGASGTGKELVARAIRQGSSRREKPFVVVNCAALPENLIESELFGHERGAFTGAVARRTGMVEAANHGTLFLDEIGDLPQQMQVKLLRFIQERTFQRIGNNQVATVDVRILAATSRDLEQSMREGRFREDLYYRLNVFPIHLPELRTRRSDILPLAEHFLGQYAERHGRRVRRLSVPAINLLMNHAWPGNVRELENCIERAVLAAHDDVIHGYDLPPSLQPAPPAAAPSPLPPENPAADLALQVADFERELIVEALKLHRGNVAAAGRHLNATPRIIRYKIRKFGISPELYA